MFVIAALAVAVLAGAVAAVSGFGIGSLLTPVLLLEHPAAHAVALVAIPHAAASVTRLARLWHDIHWPTFRQFGVASAVGGLGGALLQTALAGNALGVVLGMLLVAAGLTELTGRRVPLPEARAFRLIGGVLSGFFGGLVGNQGGIRAAALLGFRLDPRQIVATATASAVIVDLARVPVYLLAWHRVLRPELPLIAVLSAGVVAGTFIGVPLLGRIAERLYRRIVGGLLVLLGAVLIGNFAV